MRTIYRCCEHAEGVFSRKPLKLVVDTLSDLRWQIEGALALLLPEG